MTKNDQDIKQMWDIGENLGMAFQIKDDIFDFQKTNIIGKPTGIDIKEKKMTLPLIYLLNNTTVSDKKRIIKSIKAHSNNSKYVNRIIEDVRKSGGLEYAEEKMMEFRSKAINSLRSLPESDARIALEKIADYTISRKMIRPHLM